MRRIVCALALLALIFPAPARALLKNTAGQAIAVHLYTTAGSDVTTGTTTCYIVTDAGTESAGAAATHEGHGTWSYPITQAETNGTHVALTCANAAAVTAFLQTYTVPDELAREATVLGQFSVTQGIIQAPVISSSAKITVTRGDTRTLTFNLGTAWPLAGKKVYFTVKARPEDANTTALVAGTCTITDAVNGVATYTPATASNQQEKETRTWQTW